MFRYVRVENTVERELPRYEVWVGENLLGWVERYSEHWGRHAGGVRYYTSSGTTTRNWAWQPTPEFGGATGAHRYHSRGFESRHAAAVDMTARLLGVPGWDVIRVVGWSARDRVR